MNAKDLRARWRPRLTGHLVPIMPAFDRDGNLDYPSLERFIRWQLDRGTRIFWTTPGTTHYFMLSEEEIFELNRRLAGWVRGRGILIASTDSGWPVQFCRTFIREMHAAGADIVKVLINYQWIREPVVAKECTEDVIFDFVSAVAQDSPLPLFSYTLGLPGMTDSLLRRILTLPQFIALKNDSGDHYRQQELLTLLKREAPDFQTVTGGYMASHLANHIYGDGLYTACMAIMEPEHAHIFDHCMERSDYPAALAVIERHEDNWRALCGRFTGSHWSCFRTALYLMGVFDSPAVRYPLRAPSADELSLVERFIEEQGVRRFSDYQ